MINPVAFEIGPFAIRWYALCIVAGLVLAVYLENYDTHKTFDRLGNNAEELEVSGVTIPRIRIPVKTGRNISVVIEAAAMNYRAKEMGFDATRLFEERLTNLIAQNEVKHD